MNDYNISNKELNNMNAASDKEQPLRADGDIHKYQQNESHHKHTVEGRLVQSNFAPQFCSADYNNRSDIMNVENPPHIHTSEELDGHIHNHSNHGHVHSHQNTKAVVNRLSRAIGHLESIKRMVENGRDCSEVLIQLSAVKAAINNTGKVILQDHIQNCIVDAVESGDDNAISELNKAIDRFMK